MKEVLTTLTNGLRVAIVEDHFSPVVAMQLWVNVGSADEKEPQAGLAHVLEHMLFKGTKTRPVGAIAAQVEGAGGDINAFTSHDQTCYYITMSSRFAETGLEILADAVVNSNFDAGELEKELQVILEELSRGRDNPVSRISEKVFSKSYGTHPYGRPIIGYRKILQSLTRKELLGFYNAHYRPANMTLVVVGDLDSEKALKQIEGSFGLLAAKGYRHPARPIEPEQKRLRSALLFDEINSVTCNLCFHGPSFFGDDAAAVEVLAIVLGAGESSRLFKILFEQSGTAYNSWASAYLPKDPGVITAGFMCQPNQFKKAYDILLEQTFAMRAVLPSDEELEKVKRNIESELLSSLETCEGRARKLGYSLMMSGTTDLEEAFFEKVANVTAEDVRAAAQKYLRPQNLTCAVVAPNRLRSNLDRNHLITPVMKAFEKYTKDKLTPPNNSQERKIVTVETHGIHAKSKRVQKIVLDNGLRLLFAQNPSTPTFSARVALLGGRIFEPVPGVSNFASILLTKGTTEKTASELADTIEGMAASINGFSGLNTLGLSADFVSRDMEPGIELLCEILTQPAFSDEQIEKIRHELFFALERRKDRPSQVLFDLFHRNLFGSHPYSLPNLGTRETVEAIDRAAIHRFWQRALSPENMVICLSGDVNPTKATRLFESHLGNLPLRRPFKMPKAPIAPTRTIECREIMKKEQAHILLGTLGLDNLNKDRHALEVMMSVMSGQGGRLFVELRDRLHLAYAVSGFHTLGMGTGTAGFYLATGQKNINFALDQLHHHVEKLINEGITEDELERARRFLIGSYEVELAGNGSMALQMALAEVYGQGYLSHRRYAGRVSKVTRAQVAGIAKALFNAERIVTAVVAAK